MAKTIMIVEDNELNMKLFRDLLQANGYKTIESLDGSGLLDLVRANRPDLILMDIQLPEVSGFEHTKNLKADDELKDIPVLAVTAFAMSGDEERIMGAGFVGYLTKPISVPLYLETIANLI